MANIEEDRVAKQAGLPVSYIGRIVNSFDGRCSF